MLGLTDVKANIKHKETDDTKVMFTSYSSQQEKPVTYQGNL